MLLYIVLFVVLFLIAIYVNLFLALFLAVFYVFLFRVSHKEYNVTVITAETGGGKTLLANSIAQRKLKQGYNVFTTFSSKGCNYINQDFVKYRFPANSCLIIDESQMTFDSRAVSSSVKSGLNTYLLNQLSMHRHHKLDIVFISQQTDEIDVRIRRYCKELITIDKLVFIRFFNKYFKINVFPAFMIYHAWSKISDYELYQENRKYNNKPPRDFGASIRFKFFVSRDRNTYDTNQSDSFYESLPICNIKKWDDVESKYLDTSSPYARY